MLYMKSIWTKLKDKRKKLWPLIREDRDKGLTVIELAEKYKYTRQGIYWVLQHV